MYRKFNLWICDKYFYEFNFFLLFFCTNRNFFLFSKFQCGSYKNFQQRNINIFAVSKLQLLTRRIEEWEMQIIDINFFTKTTHSLYSSILIWIVI